MGTKLGSVGAGATAPADADTVPYTDLDVNSGSPGTRTRTVAQWRDSFRQMSTGAYGWTSANYYSAAAGTLRGNATAFAASALVRLSGDQSAQGTIIGTYNQYSTDGGWFISLADGRMVFGCTQDSDGQIIENGASGYLSDGGSGHGPWGKKLGRLYLATLLYNGTTLTGYVNGELVTTLTPTSGYRIANASITPMLGRNYNAGSPEPLYECEVIGAGYVESAITLAEARSHLFACMDSGQFEDLPSTGFGSYWHLYGETSAPATLSDQAAAVDFTKTGTLSVATRRSIW